MSKRRVNIGMRLFGHRHSLGRIAHRHLEVQPIRIERQIPIVDGGTLSVERPLEHEATRQDGIPKLIEFGKLLNLQKVAGAAALLESHHAPEDRKSTRLNSSHVKISYAVFCLKKNRKSHSQILI